MQSLFSFKASSGATTVVWETCAPGHGKGPWDGIGAVIKRFMRQLERHSKLYANGARDVFCALVDQFLPERVGSRVIIDAFVFHYILSPKEPPIPGRDNVWSAVTRPSARPTVTSIPGIRSSFCFRVAGENVLAYRELSCRCACCLQHKWSECGSVDAGPWKRVTMSNTAASVVPKTRGQRAVTSEARRRIAAGVKENEIIAMESAGDSEGFRFWLAVAEGPAFKYQGERKEEDGRVLIPGTWYIALRYFNRFPVNSSSTFKLGEQKQIENAEGVIARNVAVQRHGVRRSGRAHGSSRPLPPVISLDSEEIGRLNDLPSLDAL